MNLPNKITTFRMVCVVIIDFLLLFPWIECGVTLPIVFGEVNIIYLISFVLFLIASISDYFDGYFARKLHLVTTYGKFMDPIADKLLIDSLFVICAVKNPDLVPTTVAVIMIVRDLMIDVLRQVASSKGTILAANMWGKAKTVSQMVALSFVLLCDWPFSYITASWYTYKFTAIICWCAGLFSLLSGVMYYVKNWKVFKD